MERDDRRSDEGIQRPEEPRRPYERPAVLSEDVFETLALACGKLGQTTFECIVSDRS